MYHVADSVLSQCALLHLTLTVYYYLCFSGEETAMKSCSNWGAAASIHMTGESQSFDLNSDWHWSWNLHLYLLCSWQMCEGLESETLEASASQGVRLTKSQNSGSQGPGISG